MILKTASFSLGKEGRQNEDSYGIEFLESNACVAAVADGVSGNVGGAMASTLAIQCVLEATQKGENFSFKDIFSRTVNLLIDAANADKSMSDMATTLTCVKIQHGIVYFAHVGDSRIYHLRNDGIIQRTSDQTEAALLLNKGILTPSRARTYHRRAVLTSALSPRGEYTLSTGEFELLPNDRVLLLTDGVYRVLSKKSLRDLSAEQDDIIDFSKKVEMFLVEHGLVDDATMVAVQTT